MFTSKVALFEDTICSVLHSNTLLDPQGLDFIDDSSEVNSYVSYFLRLSDFRKFYSQSH